MKDFIQQIDQLLDGELDHMHESALYAELAVNADLRNEMRDHLALKSAVKDDRMALVPPAALTSSVFSGLGFAAPFAGAAATTVGSSVVWQWLTRLGLPILSAITAAGVSWGVASGNFANMIAQTGATVEPSSEQQLSSEQRAASSEPKATSNEQPATNNQQRTTSNEPRATSNELRATSDELRATSNELRATRTENERLRERIAALEAERSLAQSAPPVPVTTESTTASPQRILPLASTLMLSNTVDLQRTADPQTVRLMAYDAVRKGQKYPAMSLQVRGMALEPTTSTSVAEQADWYSNLGVGVTYLMNPHSSVVLEGGNESYPMVFTGERSGQLVQYEQYPTTMWVGIGYRYTANSLFTTVPLLPYAQAMLGGSTYGPIGRAQLGLQYAPTGPLVFLLGLEASALTFSYQNTTYISPKYGLTYGMAIRF